MGVSRGKVMFDRRDELPLVMHAVSCVVVHAFTSVWLKGLHTEHVLHMLSELEKNVLPS